MNRSALFPLLFSLLLTGLLATGSLSAQSDFSTLEEKMTGKEFTAAGLDKLSDEELAALNQWIRARSLAGYEGAAITGSGTAGDQRGFENYRGADDSDINSRLAGTFTGWTGNTVFELENGMIWEQADNASYSSSPIESPEVTITSGLLGSWRLRVEGLNRRVQVRRIQ